MGVSESTRIGTVFAGYRVEALLGRGGMSVVYLAEHIRLGRKVALKVLAAPLAHDESYRERFIRESQRAAELDHPNVIPIYDAGELDGGDADGILYIAMRYVQGSDLRTILRRDGPIGVGRTVFVLDQIASALDAAHDMDLIHRDVKPSNILVAEPTDHVYLTDFGVAKQTTAPDLTRTGMFIGTVDYAAPEQIEGLALDGRTDVYALGCVLYECLAGRPPFDREAEVAVMHAHLTTAPPKLTDAQPELPKELDRVIAKAMAKSRDERFETAPELVDAARAAIVQRRTTGTQHVEHHVDEPVTAPPPVEAREEAVAPPLVETTETPEPVSAPVSAEEPAPVEPVLAAATAPLAAATAEAPVEATPASPSAPAAPRRAPGWVGTALLVAAAALASGLVAYLVARDDGGSSATPPTATGTDTTAAVAPASLAALVPQQLWKDCAVQNQPDPGALESAVCVQSGDLTVQNPPDRWQISIYPDETSLEAAYTSAREAAGVKPGGRCDGTSWGGAGPWVHPGTPPKPGGDRFCYFDGDEAVIVWTHKKLGQPTHRDMLATAREGGTDHAGLFTWWRFWHHRIGKVGS
jgi:serine/threonine-protein kinase